MTSKTKRAILFRLVFYMAAMAFIVGVWQYQKSFLNNWIEPVNPAQGSISDKEDQELNALLEMNRLITTLGTGLLGAIGFILINLRKGKRGFEALWAACASAVCVGLSLFFGYLVYLWVIEMLKVQIFDLDMSPLMWARSAHFYTFLLAVVLFGDFAFNNLRTEDGDASKKNASSD
jgi:TRAP-type C4-dicarboxylate transport system permease small subunit